MAIVYNLLLIGDWLLANDQFRLAVLLHIFAVTPCMILASMAIKASRTRLARETAAATLPISIVLQVLLIFYCSQYPYSGHYIYLILPPLLYASTIQRLLFPYAVAVTAVSLVLLILVIAASSHIPWPVGVMATVTLSACSYSALSSNYYLEREYRKTYLQRLRDRLKLVRADAESRKDALTGLANRHVLQHRIAQIWRDADAANFPLAVALLDIDHFKAYNDRYGHPAGDVCLKRVAACLSAELRSAEDLAVRYGGEEFLLLFPRTALIDADSVARRIRSSIEALGIPHEGAPGLGKLTVSLGIAGAPSPSLSAEELVSAADAALYEAKRLGRNHVRAAIAAV